MNRTLIVFVALTIIGLSAAAQTIETSHPAVAGSTAVSAGLLHGGGALIGVDLEYFLTDRIAVQAGGGIVGLGAAVNYHLESDVYSPALSLQLWNQGLSGDLLSQRVVGVSYLYRGGEKGLTGQIGLGYVVETGKVMRDYYKKNNVAKVIPVYSFGWCF